LTQARRGILTGGSWCLDYNKLVDQWPAEDGLGEILGVEISGGGCGCNLAVAVKRLDPGFPVATIGLIGDDADGRYLLAEADRYGIDRTRLQLTAAAPTHYTEAFSSKRSGRRTHITCRGTSELLSPDHFDFSGTTQRIFHVGLPGMHRVMDGPWHGEANGWVATLKRARAAGLQTNLELVTIAPERLAPLVRPCLPHLDLLIVNDNEIAALAGSSIVSDGRTDVAGCRAAAQAVLAQGAMEVVVVHFPMGAIAATRDGGIIAQPSVNVPSSAVAGPNGAGDCFTAGFLYAFHEGRGVAQALALAHATAAASLRSVTTAGGVESWSACLALADRWGWRDPLL
jgi:sugar/nucleoside kinase (ribokinase family)